MQCSAFGCNLTITFSENRIERAHIQFHLIITGSIDRTEYKTVPEDSLRLPRLHAVFKLLRKPFGICRCGKSFNRQHGRCRMLTMKSLINFRTEPGDQYIRLKFPDDPNYITEDFFLIPNVQCLFCGFGIPKIKSAGKKLFGS